jgi:D-xylonolactonase
VNTPSRSLKAEPLLRCGNTLGEGPLWVPRARRLIWTDILERCLYSLDPRTGRQVRHELSSYVACMGECDSGELIAAGGLGWLLLGFEQGVARAQPIAGVPFDAASVRFNDGKIGSDGAFWAGTMDLNARQPIGALYRLAAGPPGGGRER